MFLTTQKSRDPKTTVKIKVKTLDRTQPRKKQTKKAAILKKIVAIHTLGWLEPDKAQLSEFADIRFYSLLGLGLDYCLTIFFPFPTFQPRLSALSVSPPLFSSPLSKVTPKLNSSSVCICFQCYIQSRFQQPKFQLIQQIFSFHNFKCKSPVKCDYFLPLYRGLTLPECQDLQQRLQRGGMGEIDFTNIIIDDFRKGKMNPFNKYIYILTHIHTDHLRGLSNTWSYGPIYCSQITASLILNKFPKLQSYLKILPIEQPQKITLAENIIATVTFFDANHCAGAVMVLLEGYFGRFLYTGDFRFDRKKFSNYTYLYPPENSNDKFEGCSRQIDKLWLDNTFCNPRFKFMAQKQAREVVTNFIKTYSQQRIYVGMDYYGKQQVLIHIAKQLDLLIVVDEQRYENIIAMQFDRELFTTNPEQGRIEVVQKPKLHDKVRDNPGSIGLVMSGWSLTAQWKRLRNSDQNRIYYVPYSLHSNYEQIVGFVKSVKPSMIQPIVSVSEQNEGNISTDVMFNTSGNAQAFLKIIQLYTVPISETYQKNLDDKEFQQILKKKFGIDRKSAQINKMELGLNTISLPPRAKGYKLTAQRDEQEIRRVKQQYERRRASRFRPITQQVQIYDGSEQEDSSEIEFISKPEQGKQGKSQKKSQKSPKSNQKTEQFKQLQRPDWAYINKLNLIQGQRNIEDNFKEKLKQMILNLM